MPRERPGLALCSGASDNGAMTVRVTRLPISFDPLMVEAKRRARHRRLAIATLAILLFGVAGSGVLALRSRSTARPLTFKAPTTVILPKAQTGAAVRCQNAAVTTIGRVPSPGEHHAWSQNWGGFAPGLTLTRGHDGSLVVACD
jgi:hypothetical protein